jgi:small multidrug resistance family-3 protein
LLSAPLGGVSRIIRRLRHQEEGGPEVVDGWAAGYASATFELVTVARSIALFLVAAVAEIGGAWLIWQGVREHRGLAWIGAGVIALGLYGFVATLQPDANFGRILAAYGGVFVAGSLAWGMALDGFRPDRYDVTGALICLVGVAVIMYAPRPT